MQKLTLNKRLPNGGPTETFIGVSATDGGPGAAAPTPLFTTTFETTSV